LELMMIDDDDDDITLVVASKGWFGKAGRRVLMAQ